MIHEPTIDRKSAGVDRRRLSASARRSGGAEPSPASALRQRVGNQGMQRLIRIRMLTTVW
ncbi:hypothetical protein ABIC10_008333 [Bradyrhizobium sp. S3.2.12]